MTIDRTRVTLSIGGVTIPSLWAHKWLVLAVTGLCVLAGVAYVCVAVPVYEVKTRLSIAKGGDPSKAVPDDVREDRYFMGTQAEAISSPLIVRKAMAEAPLTIPARYADDPMRFVLESLKVSPIVNTNVMAIRFHGSNSDEALRFVSALVKSYEEYIQTTETNSGGAAMELLAQRERELRDELKAAEQAYAELRKASPLVGQGNDQIASSTEVLGAISRSLGEVRVRRCELQSRLAMVEQAESGDWPRVKRTSALASRPSWPLWCRIRKWWRMKARSRRRSARLDTVWRPRACGTRLNFRTCRARCGDSTGAGSRIWRTLKSSCVRPRSPKTVSHSSMGNCTRPIGGPSRRSRNGKLCCRTG